MGSRASATVLIAEDEAAVRHITRLLLERAGYAVLETENGRDAVAALARHDDEIDVLLLDVMMPEMTGSEAFPVLRELRPDLPIIFFTGYGEREVARHLAAPTAYTSVLAKPSSIDQLTGEIERALDSRRPRGAEDASA